MGLMKKSPSSGGRPPRRGGGGGGGGGRLPSGGAGSVGLPGGDGGGCVGGADEPSGRPARDAYTCYAIPESTGGGGGGLLRRGQDDASETRAMPSRDGETGQGTRGTPRGDGAARTRGILAGRGGGASSLQGRGKEDAASGAELGGGNEGRGPFSGFLVLCVDTTDEGFEVYKQKIEALGGQVVTGFQYSTATHIALEGNIPPGGRVLWEGDGKVVTTTRWIDGCFEAGKLLCDPLKDCSESILPISDVTPLASNKSTGRSCSSDGKLSAHRHGSNKRRSSQRRINFSGMYHHLLSCEEDQRKSQSLYDYALGLRPYQNETLPGRTGTFKICKVSMKFILGRCFSIMVSFHARMKSLGGLLCSKSFSIYSDDSVLLDVTEAALVPYSETEGDRDYAGFVQMVKTEVFHNQKLPVDIIEWLRLMSKGVSAFHRNLLSNYIYLMEPFQGFGAFVTMYLQFTSIQSTEGWEELSKALRSYDNWNLPCSSIMMKTFHYIDKNGNKVHYEPDITGLLRLIWNCSKHQAKREVKSFIHMVIVEYPYLLSDLQRALYQLGYLTHLTLKN